MGRSGPWPATARARGKDGSMQVFRGNLVERSGGELKGIDEIVNAPQRRELRVGAEVDEACIELALDFGGGEAQKPRVSSERYAVSQIGNIYAQRGAS